MQETAVFLGIQERLQEVCHRKARAINKNVMKGRNSSKKSVLNVDFMKQPFNNQFI
jgi:hypothetical protein